MDLLGRLDVSDFHLFFIKGLEIWNLFWILPLKYQIKVLLDNINNRKINSGAAGSENQAGMYLMTV